MEFNSFDHVLVRNKNNEPWEVQIFSRYIEGTDFPYQCINQAFKQCTSYKGHENLLGTTTSLGWRPKENELILATDYKRYGWTPVFFKEEILDKVGKSYYRCYHCIGSKYNECISYTDYCHIKPYIHKK